MEGLGVCWPGNQERGYRLKYRLEPKSSLKAEWEPEDRGLPITRKQSETRIGSYGIKLILAISPWGFSPATLDLGLVPPTLVATAKSECRGESLHPGSHGTTGHNLWQKLGNG